MPKILIFGGAGYLGSAISENLSTNSRFELFVNSRNRLKESRLFLNKIDQKVQMLNIDATNFDDVKKTLEDISPEVIIDLTGLVDVTKSTMYPKESFESSAITTLHILESIRILNLNSVYLNHSSDKVYANNESPFTENMSLLPYHIYDVGKLTQESISNSYNFHYGIKTLNLRCANYYGPYDFDFNRIIPYLMKSFIKNEEIVLRSSTDFRRDFLYIEEAAKINNIIFDFIMDKDDSIFGETYNFSQEQDYSIQEVINLISKISPNSPKIVQNQGKLNNETEKLLLDCSKAKAKFKWENTTSFEEGLKYTHDYYVSYLNKKH
jgi:nucleoside-diphosphate-sugar epimerase